MKKLKFARVAADLTQHQLGQRLGCSQQLVSLIEVGTVRPTAVMKKKIAEVLNLEPEIIFPSEE